MHRLLSEILEGKQEAMKDELGIVSLRFIAERCNTKKDAAKQAGDDTDMLFLNIFVRERAKANDFLKFNALVIDLGPQSFTVFIPELAVTKRIHATKDWKAITCEVTRKVDGGLVTTVKKREEGKKSKDEKKNEGLVVSLVLTFNQNGDFLELKLLKKLNVLLTPKIGKKKKS